MTAQRVHFIGIGGSGLSAIARLLVESGYVVSGSDRVPSALALDLAAAGVRVYTGHKAEHVAGADLVIRSSAIPDDNPEVLAARQAGIPVLKRSEYLGQWMENRLGIAIAGSHGKTTTTAMMAWTLVCLQQDPSYIIGGVSKNLGSNAHAGQGHAFVIEADEYDRMFLGLQPEVAIITNVEHDHPDCFPTPAEYRQAFADFVHSLKAQGVLITSLDDTTAAGLVNELPAGRQAVTYGMHPLADYQARSVTLNALGGYSFEVWRQHAGQPTRLATISLQVPGEHNVRNATAVVAAAHQLHLDLEGTARALASFSGTGRRFDIRGEAEGIIIVDDYAHHPTEIRATLAAARRRFPGRRLWAVWQPHTYSRTAALLDDFAAAFKDADCVIVTEIFASREKPTDFSAYRVVRRMQHPAVHFTPALEQATAHLLASLRPGDVLIVLSAGDADQISGWVLAALQAKETNHD